KLRCSVCVAAYPGVERPTSVVVSALGSSRSASAAPAAARRSTTAPTATGRRAARPMTRPSIRASIGGTVPSGIGAGAGLTYGVAPNAGGDGFAPAVICGYWVVRPPVVNVPCALQEGAGALGDAPA